MSGIFAPKPNSAKMVCTICGRTGYGVSDGWAAACRAGHPFACPICGRRFADRYGVGQHRRRTGHQAVLS